MKTEINNTNTHHSPTVSVIMNCYNSAKYLREAIDSVYAQSFKDWEIVFYDNSSTDNSAEIAKSYDNKLHYFTNEQNVPLGKARNLALEKCRGQYITFLDCDDIWFPEKLEKQVSLFNEKKDIDFIYSNYYDFYMEEGIRIVHLHGAQPEGNVMDSFLRYYPVGLITVMLSKRILSQSGIMFDDTLQWSEEYDLFMRILYKARAAYINEPLGLYRNHPLMTSVRLDIQFRMNETRYVIEKLRKNEKNFDLQYADAIKVNFRINDYYLACGHMENGNMAAARSLLSKHKYTNINYFIRFIFTFLPSWVLKQLIAIKTRIIFMTSKAA